MKVYLSIIYMVLLTGVTTIGQVNDSPKFRDVVDTRLRTKYGSELSKICPIDTDTVAERVFRDYGAIFVSNNGGIIPTSCVFEDEETVQAFQKGVGFETASIGNVAVTLQKAALRALLDARAEAAKLKLNITPRGGETASTRSYKKTEDLWKSRFFPGLAHWTAAGRISPADAAAARKATIRKQVEMVLAWESRGFWFSTDFSKSILYSVAAPGASQHIFGLALDVEQFGNARVRQVLARHGWYQTVKSDLPHFTFLGLKDEFELKAFGLIKTKVGGQEFWIPNM